MVTAQGAQLQLQSLCPVMLMGVRPAPPCERESSDDSDARHASEEPAAYPDTLSTGPVWNTLPIYNSSSILHP